MSYIYIASPYTAKTKKLKKQRYEDVEEYLAVCTSNGEIAFSPIVHGHGLATKYDLPTDWEFWQKHCKAFIDPCSKLRVLKLDGWDKSVGVTAEIAYAESIGKEVEYVDVISG